ncbi:MAG: hypothetical protein LBQ79_00305 [Deltaproteobacteria bacterium]|jgi:hypothetical protein|nr:hypothetical protein [Deltaproteobacteria bacterium]
MGAFYTSPGNVTGRSVFIALCSAGAASALAPLYAACTLYAHWITASAALLLCYGTATGLAAGAAARATRTLSPGAASALALLGGWTGFALSWAVWAGLVAEFGGAGFPGFREISAFLASPRRWAALMSDPPALFGIAGELYGRGLWKLSGSSLTINGIPCLVLWAGEFLVFSLCVARWAIRSARVPYSFEAGAYLREEAPLPRGAALPGDPALLGRVTGAMRAGDLGYLAVASPAAPGEPGLHVAFRSHPLSPWGTASVSLVGRGGRLGRSRELVRNVLLSGRAMDIVRCRMG